MFARSFIACCAAAVLAVGCSSQPQPESEPASKSVEMRDGYVKAMADDAKMTGIFGTVTNHSDKDVTIVGFEADVTAGSYEVHEVVDGKMKEKEDGLTIPAGQTTVMEPGSYHLMLMDVPTPIKAGDNVAVTLKLDDGSTVAVGDLPVRTIASGEENYSSHN